MSALFYESVLEPHFTTDLSPVTLSSSYKALYTPSNFPYLGPGFFSRPGKRLRIMARGKMTTGATPGNLTLGLLYGTGADNNGVVVVASGAVALVANGTNLPWEVHIDVHCRSIGSAGTLFAMGSTKFALGLMLSTVQPVFLPASAPVVSGACDLTAALILSLQALRSGSTAESMTVQDMRVTEST